MTEPCPVCKKEIEPLAAIIGPYHAGCAPIKKIAKVNDMTMGDISICWGCAAAKGGLSPDPSVVTSWIGTCIICKMATGVTHVRDFRWPGGVRPTACP